MQHRISVALSDDAHEALRTLAFRERIPVARAAQQLLYGALALATPPEQKAPGQSSSRTHAVRENEAQGPRKPTPKYDRRHSIDAPGDTWSVICPRRNQHVLGEQCSHCGGSRPR